MVVEAKIEHATCWCAERKYTGMCSVCIGVYGSYLLSYLNAEFPI